MASRVKKTGEKTVIEHNRSLRGILEKYAKRHLTTEEFREAREKAWAEAVTEDWKRQDGEF